MDRLVDQYRLPNVLLAFVQLFLFSVVSSFVTVFAYFTVSMPVSMCFLCFPDIIECD